MDLETYIERLKACPDDELEFVEQVGGQSSSARMINRLTHEWGVYDNFPILIRGEVGLIAPLLVETGIFVDPQLPLIGNSPGDVRKRLHYSKGTIRLQTFNGAHFLTRDPVHSAYQNAQLTMGFTLHPYEERKAAVPDLRVMAWAIEDIGLFAKNHGIPLCLPQSVGWKDRSDLSQVVYLNLHPPIKT